MHAGASGIAYVIRVKYGEVGSAVRLSAVPGRRAVEDVGWRTLIRESVGPFHSVRRSSATLRFVSLMYGVAGLPMVEYHVCTTSSHKVMRTGPVLSIKTRSQAVFVSLFSRVCEERFRGDPEASLEGSSRGLGSPYTNFLS